MEQRAERSLTPSDLGHALCSLRDLEDGSQSFTKEIVAAVGPWLAYWTIRVLGKTMRFEEVHPEIPRSFLEKGTPAIGHSGMEDS